MVKGMGLNPALGALLAIFIILACKQANNELLEETVYYTLTITFTIDRTVNHQLNT